jgi:hypothetical protein
VEDDFTTEGTEETEERADEDEVDAVEAIRMRLRAGMLAATVGARHVVAGPRQRGAHAIGTRSQRRLCYPAVMCWSIFIVAALTLTACAANQPQTGPSTPRGTFSGITSCPTPTAPAGAITPPVVKGATIITTADGLQEIDVQVGCGSVVQVGQTVIVEYTGWVQGSGKLFDSSFERQPGDCEGTMQNTCGFALSQDAVIQGWVEGVAGMKVGGTRRLIIPPALAYGAQGQPPVIPANATLIFDITVVAVQ